MGFFTLACMHAQVLPHITKQTRRTKKPCPGAYTFAAAFSAFLHCKIN